MEKPCAARGDRCSTSACCRGRCCRPGRRPVKNEFPLPQKKSTSPPPMYQPQFFAEVRRRALEYAVNLVHWGVVHIRKRHRAVEVRGRVKAIGHDAAIDPARQRRVVLLEQTAVVEQMLGGNVVASQRATVWPAEERPQFEIAIQQMGELPVAATVAVATGVAATATFAAGIATAATCRDAAADAGPAS